MFGTLLFESGLVEPLILFVREAQLPWLEFPLLVLLIWALRWLGLAPVISLMILGPAFAPAVSLPPPLYALALAFGGIVGFLGSPLSATNLFVASATGFSPFDVSIRHQGPYVAALAVLTSLYAFALAVAMG
jgi:C4-dicarboxylate transporter